MRTDDRARTELHERLDGAVGKQAADTLMGYLPPVGWAEVATKHDLEALRLLMQADTRIEIEKLRADLHNALRLQAIALITVILAIAGIARVV